MDIENKNENILDVLENKEIETKKTSKWFLLVYVYYLIILISSVLIIQGYSDVVINLGDFGSITGVVFYVLSITSLKWMPLLSICGILLYNKRNKVKDISSLYLFLVSLIYVVSLIILIVNK